MQKTTFFILTLFFLVACSSESPSNEESLDEQTTNGVAEQEIADSSSITCPECGYTTIEELPTEVCLLAYDCDSCSYTMHPKGGDCCVFCTHGTVKCPSIQEKEE